MGELLVLEDLDNNQVCVCDVLTHYVKNLWYLGGHSGGFGGFDFFGQQDNGGSTFSSGFSFGGSSPSQQSVKQDGGSSTFSGGFLFGGNPPQQDAGGMKQDGGNSTFSSGFSFGGNSPSQQDTGGEDNDQ